MDKEDLTRSQENTRTKRRQENKMNRTLNYLIALVSVLLVITLGVIFIVWDEDEAEEQLQTEDAALEAENLDAVEEDKQEDETEAGQSATTNDATNDQSDENDSTVDANQDEAVINASDDPLVAEIWTNDAWQAYQTVQTGEHQSTFTQGHIDYEEKLQSIFSVVPIEQQESIIWSVKNNGNAKSAIAVISSNDKTQKYRVAIEWIEQQGWKPVQVEVLNTLEGTY